MKYNPEIHHRKSIRLKEYDYTKEGVYFVTICTHNRECVFGEIIRSNVGAGFSCPEMQMSKVGIMITDEIKKMSDKYKNIIVDKYVIMPNHIHLLIKIIGDLKKGQEDPAPTIGNAIGYFKFISTKLYNDMLEIKNDKYLKLWQRNYYENIIRDEEIYIKVSEYIKNNVLNWENDKYFS